MNEVTTKLELQILANIIGGVMALDSRGLLLVLNASKDDVEATEKVKEALAATIEYEEKLRKIYPSEFAKADIDRRRTAVEIERKRNRHGK